MNRKFVKKYATALVLSALTLAVGAFVFIDRGSVSTGEAEARKSSLLPAWRAEDVTRVEVLMNKGSYALTRAAKGEKNRTWDLTLANDVFPAEEQVVDRLLSTIEYAKFLREVPRSSVNRAELGLDAPTTTIAVAMGELKFVITIGAAAASGEGVYAEVEGRGVYVIAQGLAAALAIPPDDLRSRAFVPYMSTDLASLSLEGEGGTRTFERAPWGGGRGSGFRFAQGSEGPTGDRVDGLQLDQVLVAFGRMQAEVFLDEAAANSASAPRVTVTMVPKEGPNGVLKIGGACPGKEGFVVVVRSEPSFLAACVPASVIDPLLKPAADFEDDGIVGASVDEIVELTIERADKVLEIARYGPGFKVRKPDEREIDAETGNDLLFDIVNARGKRAPAGTPAPSGELTKIRIKSQGGIKEGGGTIERVEELELGPALADGPNAGKHIALRKEDGALIILGDAAASVLQPSDLLLRDLSVVDLSTLDIENLTIEHGADKQSFSRADASYALSLPVGKGLRADVGFASAAVSTLAKLTAERWVADAPAPAFGLDNPRFVVTAAIAKDPQDPKRPTTLKLLLGARTDDGTYASVDRAKGVFLVSRQVEEAFDRSFVARDAFTIEPSTADKIEIACGAKRLALARDGRQLRLASGDDAKAASVEKALAQLSAVRALGAGPAKPSFGLAEPTLKITVTRRKGSTDDAALPLETHTVVGAGDTIDGVGIRYARRDDVDATFLVSVAAATRLTELCEGK